MRPCVQQTETMQHVGDVQVIDFANTFPGGTRFIGLYLARQLVEQGHDVTLYTRGKKAVTAQIPEDSDEGYANFASKIKHISGDRMVGGSLHSPLHSTDQISLWCILDMTAHVFGTG